MKIHKIRVATPPFDKHYFGTPWIATVDFSSNPDGEFCFGTFLQEGKSAGHLEVDAETGDIVALLKKDLKAPNKLPPKWYKVSIGGTLVSLANIFEARREFELMAKLRPDNPGKPHGTPAPRSSEFDFTSFEDSTLIRELEKRGYAIQLAGPVQDSLF